MRRLLIAGGSTAADKSAPLVLSMHFRNGKVSLQLSRTIVTLGTPHDVTVQEPRNEDFYSRWVKTPSRAGVRGR